MPNMEPLDHYISRPQPDTSEEVHAELDNLARVAMAAGEALTRATAQRGAPEAKAIAAAAAAEMGVAADDLTQARTAAGAGAGATATTEPGPLQATSLDEAPTTPPTIRELLDMSEPTTADVAAADGAGTTVGDVAGTGMEPQLKSQLRWGSSSTPHTLSVSARSWLPPSSARAARQRQRPRPLSPASPPRLASAERLFDIDVARIRSTVAGRRGRLSIGGVGLLRGFWERWLVIGRCPVRQRTASQDLERGTEPIGFGLSLGEPTAEVFDLVPKLGDGGVLGRNLGTVGPLGRAAVLGDLHLIGDLRRLQGLAACARRASWPMDQPPRFLHGAPCRGDISRRAGRGGRFSVIWLFISHNAKTSEAKRRLSERTVLGRASDRTLLVTLSDA